MSGYSNNLQFLLEKELASFLLDSIESGRVTPDEAAGMARRLLVKLPENSEDAVVLAFAKKLHEVMPQIINNFYRKAGINDS